MGMPHAGWYQDPGQADQQRWWDGAAWGDHVYRGGVVLSQPLVRRRSPSAPTTHTAAEKPHRRVPVWVWIVGAVIALILLVVLSPVLAAVSLVVLITAIVAVAKGTPTWLRLRSKGTAVAVTAVSAVALVISSGVASVAFPRDSTPPTAEPSAVIETPASVTPSHSDTATAEDDAAEPVAFDGAARTQADTSATAGKTALAVLETLPVTGRASKAGYSRDAFGQRWLDVDRNGCDTRNDTLSRDLVDVTKSGPCKVLTGALADPYTGKTIAFQRGQGTSELVQIDHVVALSDAWQKGAQQLSLDQRASLANDPINVLAVSQEANQQKGEGDAATWLPSNKAFRCTYVAHQVSVKATYGLRVTQAEHDAIARILSACPDEPAVTSPFAAEPPPPPAPEPEPVQPAQPAPPAPAPPAPAPPADVHYADCAAVRAAGKAPLYADEPGYNRKLDRDGDGIACE